MTKSESQLPAPRVDQGRFRNLVIRTMDRFRSRRNIGTGDKYEIESDNELSDVYRLAITERALPKNADWLINDRVVVKAVIDRMIEAIPDNPTIYPSIDALTQREPTSDFELFLLSKLKELPRFAGPRPDGSMYVMESISCIEEKIRTKKFLLGVRESIAKLDVERKKRIDVVDAGCGALPIMSIYAALCSDKVRCTALELNPNSARIAQEVVRGFGLQDRIKIIQADAKEFKPGDTDLLISETMLSGLTFEPIVQILSNLAPYLREGGIILPSRVSVRAALVSIDDYNNPQGFVVGSDYTPHHVIELNWQNVLVYSAGDNLRDIHFELPAGDLPKGDYWVAVTSEVNIGTQRLGPYESDITSPAYLYEKEPKMQRFTLPGDGSEAKVVVHYAPGDPFSNEFNTVGALVSK